MNQIEFYDDLKLRLAEVQSGVREIRENAESEVRRMRDENTTKFLASLVKEIANESSEENVRMMACVVCKNLISSRSVDAAYADLWVKLEPAFKNNVKEAILSTLNSTIEKVRS